MVTYSVASRPHANNDTWPSRHGIFIIGMPRRIHRRTRARQSQSFAGAGWFSFPARVVDAEFGFLERLPCDEDDRPCAFVRVHATFGEPKLKFHDGSILTWNVWTRIVLPTTSGWKPEDWQGWITAFYVETQKKGDKCARARMRLFWSHYFISRQARRIYMMIWFVYY